MDRYDMEIEYDREGMQSVEEEKHSEGDWVKYEDVKSLLNSLLQKAIEEEETECRGYEIKGHIIKALEEIK